MLFRILLAAESPEIRSRVRPFLEATGALVSETSTPDGFWARLGAETYDLVVAGETTLPEPVEASIVEVRNLPDRPEVIVLTDREDPEGRANLQAAGCLAIVSHALGDTILRESLTALVRRQRETAVGHVQAEQASRRSDLHDFSARSTAMKELLRLARKIATADTSLLLLGETGVGKEWLARAIHTEGPRSEAPFIAINCAAVPETLLESELFGHEKGAFTGALRARRGHFELAHRGTLFLDEIGDLPFHLQAKLLRVLQERSIQRIGSETSLPVDVRLMAATNQDLETAIEEGTFRRDLYYRLSVMTLVVPPLRQRREDIPPLVETYFEQFRGQLGRSDIEGVSSAAMEALASYAWPGNVRELVNVLERAVLLCEGELVTLDDLPDSITADSAAAAASRQETTRRFLVDLEPWFDQPLAAGREAVTETFERTYLRELLDRNRGHVGRTAAEAGIDPRTLYNKMRALGLRKESFKRRS